MPNDVLASRGNARPVSQSEIDLRADLENARDAGDVGGHGELSLRAAHGDRNLWVTVALRGTDVLSLRLGPNLQSVANFQQNVSAEGLIGLDFTTPLGAMRARIEFFGAETLRCTSSLLPASDTYISPWPRDVFMLGHDSGSVFTAQRGLRSGVVFAGSAGLKPTTVFYLQNFSALTNFFEAMKRTPADSVGGKWPELGFVPPTNEDAVLPMGREIVVSDVYLTLSNESRKSEEEIAGLYLDMFAQTYLALERPAVSYHAWDERAAVTLRDLTLSPACTYVRQGAHFLKPYVGDETKPPESMVQFTVAVNVAEYDRWRNTESRLGALLRDTAPKFHNEKLGSVVRWLPGETFDAGQAEENMSHEAMDSWYLHHSLFNLIRLVNEGDARARAIVENSLPYVIRVAHRFNYQWPIFFNLDTLEIIRAEAAPGQGGETDVGGLYALVMLHAYELFGDADYLQEAHAAMSPLFGLGFNLAYQLNTTGFAAEAALRLWKLTEERRYLGLAETALANLFDNMWLWQCEYEHAAHYPTFFGLFPLRDAPYIAPYEELEAHAKFHEFLVLAGDDIRPSLRLLLAEFQKYSLDRCWYYYPDALPKDCLSAKSRNGNIERALSVPLEDLRDGRERSGQVGQEVYGAGLPFVLTARHYMRLADGFAMAFCNYPMFDFVDNKNGSATWSIGGDPLCSAELRVFPTDISAPAAAISVFGHDGDRRVPVCGTLSPEGHAIFSVRGGQTVGISCTAANGKPEAETVVIGSFNARPGQR